MNPIRAFAIWIYQRLPCLQRAYRCVRPLWARRRLRRMVAKVSAQGKPLQVVIGANNKYQSGWIPTEIYNLNILDQRDWDRYFQPESISALVAEHVWEHLTVEQGAQAARLCYRYLQPGGRLRVAVPDGFFPDPKYIEYVRPGGVGPSADDHKVLYDYRSFGPVFSSAGFRVELLEHFDENGEFHEQPWTMEDGLIVRSKRYYNGNNTFGGRKYTSLILDAVKGA